MKGLLRVLLAFSSLCIVLFAGSCIAAESHVDDLRTSQLKKHAYERTEYDPDIIGFLMGNGEMGGVADNGGLGFERLWLADLWRDPQTRIPLYGPLLKCDRYNAREQKPVGYSQRLDLHRAVLTTRVDFADEGGYETEVFISAANKDILVIKVKDTAPTGAAKWTLRLPLNDTTVTGYGSGIVMNSADKPLFKARQIGANRIEGALLEQQTSLGKWSCYGPQPVEYEIERPYTRICWIATCSNPLTPIGRPGHYTFELEAGQEAVIVFATTNHWDGADYVERARNSIVAASDYGLLKAAHSAAWCADWRKTAVVEIPEERFEREFYRSIYLTLCTATSDKFMPGEAQFARPCWRMAPFSYGMAGWGVYAFAAIGLPENAQKLAKLHFKPEALKRNSRYYISEEKNNGQIFNFAHMMLTSGDVIPGRVDKQRHIDAYVGAFYHMVSSHYADQAFTLTYTYPVLRATAMFWQNICTWDESLRKYSLPPLTSVGEHMNKKDLFDCAMSAKWTLMMASRYAEKLGFDKEFSDQWRKISGAIVIPQKDERFLEWPTDDERRTGDDGYGGIRAFVYAGYPVRELIPLMDKDKIAATLYKTWDRNFHGRGMISFVASWHAINAFYYGLNDLGYEILAHNFNCYDPSKTALCEIAQDNRHSPFKKPYFGTSYTAYIPAVLATMLQSYDHKIMPFPAVPTEWKKNIAFHNLPAEEGIKVSGRMKNGRIDWITCNKNSQQLLRTRDNRTIRILQKGTELILRPE